MKISDNSAVVDVSANMCDWRECCRGVWCVVYC